MDTRARALRCAWRWVRVFVLRWDDSTLRWRTAAHAHSALFFHLRPPPPFQQGRYSHAGSGHGDALVRGAAGNGVLAWRLATRERRGIARMGLLFSTIIGSALFFAAQRLRTAPHTHTPFTCLLKLPARPPNRSFSSCRLSVPAYLCQPLFLLVPSLAVHASYHLPPQCHHTNAKAATVPANSSLLFPTFRHHCPAAEGPGL